jgi:hypothetical protein
MNSITSNYVYYMSTDVKLSYGAIQKAMPKVVVFCAAAPSVPSLDTFTFTSNLPTFHITP